VKKKLLLCLAVLLLAGCLTLATAFLPRSSEYASPEELGAIWFRKNSADGQTVTTCMAMMPSCGVFEGGTKKTSGYPFTARTVYQEDDYVVDSSWDRDALLKNYAFYLLVSGLVVYIIWRKYANNRD
jgi:hypothetical protein